MTRAESKSSRGIIILMAAAVLLSGTLLGWRELRLRGQLAEHRATGNELRSRLAAAGTALEEQRNRIVGLEETIEELNVSIQSLEDRSKNLSAQRDHLRAEADRLAEQGRLRESSLESMQARMESLRSELLEAQARPRELAGRLEACNGQVEELESLLDEQAALLSHLPGKMEWNGASSDGTVFALAGQLPEERPFPFPVYLCGTGGVYLEGWMHRREGEMMVGHVDRWRTRTSALVKGQKVFILPRQSYEADQ